MPESQAQVRLAHAVLSGKARSKMPHKVAKEIVGKMHGKKMSSLPKKKRRLKSAIRSKLHKMVGGY